MFVYLTLIYCSMSLLKFAVCKVNTTFDCHRSCRIYVPVYVLVVFHLKLEIRLKMFQKILGRDMFEYKKRKKEHLQKFAL